MSLCATPAALGHDLENDNLQLIVPEKVDITQNLHYFQFPQGDVPETKIELDDLLKTLQPHVSTNTFGDRFIATLMLENSTDINDWFIYPSGAIVENIQVYVFRENGKIDSFTTGHNHKNQIDHHYGGRIVLDQGERVTIALLFDSDIYSSPVRVFFLPFTAAERSLEKENYVLLISIGVCIALAVYNLFLYYGTRQIQYLYYSLATFGFTLGWAQVFGIFHFAFGRSPLEWIAIPFFFAFIFIVQFTSHFLQLKTDAPRLDYTLRLMAILSLICLPISYLSLGASLILASLFGSIILVVSLYAGIKSWRGNYAPAKYFVFALLSVMAPNIVGNFLNMGLLPGVEINIYLLSQIGNSLDSLLLAFALAERVRLINAQNHSLTEQLEERVKQRTEELVDANERLEKLITNLRDADDAKNVFLANMSHEIRTPLTSIIGYADGLLNGDIPQSDFKNSVRIISQNGNHLVNIISDILDLTKIEAKKLEYEILPTNLADILEQVSGLHKVRANEKGVDFVIDCQFPLPLNLHTDPTRLKQILFNLISNAIKFTEKGYVSLNVSARNNRLYFEVKDTGIGMTQSQIDKLFTPFEQGDKAISRQYGGTGLGLSISKHLITDLGGEINVKSSLAQGSTFSFCLPIKDIDQSAWVSHFKPTEVQEELEACALPDFNNAQVLLVDDHGQNRDLISRLMSKMNINVVEAQSGMQALECLANFPNIALILLDIQMPHMSGVETLGRIRKKGVDVPVIALTANSMQHEIKQYLDQGFSDHLGKPLVRDDFIQKLTYYLPWENTTQGGLTREDMLEMSNGYFHDLKQRLADFEISSSQSDYVKMQDIAHAIKGSAGSFGFQPFTQIFEQFEQVLKDQEYTKVSSLLSQLQKLCAWSIQCKLIDVPLAIANHENDLNLYHQALNRFLPIGQESLLLLGQAITQSDKNAACIHLFKFKSECRKLALVSFEQHSQTIADSLMQIDWDPTTSSATLVRLRAELDQLFEMINKN